MRNALPFYVILVWLLLYTSIESNDEYALHYYTFNNDALTARCTKPKPLIFQLMFDFLSMILAEAAQKSQTCVINKQGFGFLSPIGVARNIFAVNTIVYNTYARYNGRARPTILYSGWRRTPLSQRTVPPCVYIYGFYQIANYLIPERLALYSFKEKYEQNYGCNLTQISASINSPLGLVQRDVDQLKSQLETDGFNQAGCFADTTNFKPINPPCTLDTRSTVETCRNFTHTHNTIWNYGEFVKTGYINKPRETFSSQAQTCRPFSLNRLYDYLAPPYFQAPAFENGTMVNLSSQFLELTAIQSNLDVNNDKPKLIAEFWESGPSSSATPGLWQSISLNIIRRLCYSNEDALKLLFAVSAATYDAGLAAWQNKRLYNTVRPVTFIPTEYINDTFNKQFVGMYCNFMDIQGWQWAPYQRDEVVTPQFQEYISGHSTFSQAAAFILEKFTGSPNISGNLSVTIKAGQSSFQPRCNRSNVSCYRKCRVDDSLDSENNYIPKVDVTLGPWTTYRQMADEAGISRRYGGIHIASGDIQGRIIGRKVGEAVWAKISILFNQPVSSSSKDKIPSYFHFVAYFIGLAYYYYQLLL